MVIRDIEPANECIEYCLTNRYLCTKNCYNDASCLFQCNSQFDQCYNSCPCLADCPQGCSACTSTFCACTDFENSEDYLQCEEGIINKNFKNIHELNLTILKAYFNRIYNICILSCSNGDFMCIGACSREYEANMATCPCQSGCPNGCPCPEYTCPAPTTGRTTTSATVSSTTIASQKNTVLVQIEQGKDGFLIKITPF